MRSSKEGFQGSLIFHSSCKDEGSGTCSPAHHLVDISESAVYFDQTLTLEDRLQDVQLKAFWGGKSRHGYSFKLDLNLSGVQTCRSGHYLVPLEQGFDQDGQRLWSEFVHFYRLNCLTTS